MKKSILILMLTIFVGLSTYSQNESLDATLGYNETYSLYTGTTSDYIYTGDSIWSYVVKKYTDEKLFPYIYLELDSLDGTAADVSVVLKYKMFDDQTFTTSTTVTYGGTADTTIVIAPGAAIKADIWQLYIVGSTDGFKVAIDQLNMKFIK